MRGFMLLPKLGVLEHRFIRLWALNKIDFNSVSNFSICLLCIVYFYDFGLGIDSFVLLVLCCLEILRRFLD